MINEHTILGRLGKDPEVRHLESGKVVASFSMATTEKWKNEKGELQERTEWHNVVCWGKQAEVIEKYVSKGDLLYVKGKARNRSYEDKDGVKKYIHETQVEQLILMPNGKKDEASKPKAKDAPTKESAEPVVSADDNDDPPF